MEASTVRVDIEPNTPERKAIYIRISQMLDEFSDFLAARVRSSSVDTTPASGMAYAFEPRVQYALREAACILRHYAGTNTVSIHRADLFVRLHALAKEERESGARSHHSSTIEWHRGRERAFLDLAAEIEKVQP